MIRWRHHLEEGLGVLQKVLGVYNTVKGIYEVGKVVAPIVAAAIVYSEQVK